MSYNGYGRDTKRTDMFAQVGVITAHAVVEQSPDGKSAYQQCRLELMQGGGVDDGAYYPPSDLSIYGLPQLVTLRDLIDRVIAYAHLGIEGEPLVESVNRIKSEGVSQ